MRNINKKYETFMNLDDEKVAENNISNLEEFEIIIPKEVSEKVDIQDLDICFL